MAEYQTNSNGPLTFDLLREGNSIGILLYKNWFNFNADIELANGAKYQVKPKSFWGTTIEVSSLEQLLLTFGMGWNGDISIQTFFGEIERGYTFKHHGVFKESFVLTDQAGCELLVMKPHINWSRMNYQYKLTSSQTLEAMPNKEILLMNSVHWANYYMSMIANAVGI